jgi:hypothetical protein
MLHHDHVFADTVFQEQLNESMFNGVQIATGYSYQDLIKDVRKTLQKIESINTKALDTTLGYCMLITFFALLTRYFMDVAQGLFYFLFGKKKEEKTKK